MAYGSILSEVSGFTLLTADNIRKEVRNNFFTRIALKVFGIPHIGLRIRAREILKFLEPKSDDVILDAGCGMGLLLLTLGKKIGRGIGVDIDIEKIKEALRLKDELSLDNIEFYNVDAANLEFPESFFDKIVCSEVLEHIEDDRKVVNGFFRMLKPGGKLVISTTSLSEICRNHKDNFGHARAGYSPEELRAIFCDAGFRVEEMRPYCVQAGKIAWLINRMLLKFSFLNILLFYPLMVLAYFDRFVPSRLNKGCVGYIIKLRK